MNETNKPYLDLVRDAVVSIDRLVHEDSDRMRRLALVLSQIDKVLQDIAIEFNKIDRGFFLIVRSSMRQVTLVINSADVERVLSHITFSIVPPNDYHQAGRLVWSTGSKPEGDIFGVDYVNDVIKLVVAELRRTRAWCRAPNKDGTVDP
jgi:hypothetical protein